VLPPVTARVNESEKKYLARRPHGLAESEGVRVVVPSVEVRGVLMSLFDFTGEQSLPAEEESARSWE